MSERQPHRRMDPSHNFPIKTALCSSECDSCAAGRRLWKYTLHPASPFSLIPGIAYENWPAQNFNQWDAHHVYKGYNGEYVSLLLCGECGSAMDALACSDTDRVMIRVRNAVYAHSISGKTRVAGDDVERRDAGPGVEGGGEQDSTRPLLRARCP